MTRRRLGLLALALISLGWSGALAGARGAAPRATGWLHWRGPHQNGTSDETGLPDRIELGGANHLWSLDLAGRGTPVIAGDRVYAFGYRGEGPDLQEVLVCLQADTGRVLWEQRFNDFLSDIVYDRYSIGSPTVDPETGNVYLVSAAGEFACFTAEGRQLWRHSLMEELGRLTFPNGRNGAPVIEDDLVIIRAITGNWGGDGAAADRFYAFDKRTGHLVWSSTPGTAPKDNSFAAPLIVTVNGKRVLFSGTGCGHLVAINARTGEPLWRYPIAQGGINASCVRYRDTTITIHEVENVDSSEIGRMVAVRDHPGPAPGQPGPVVLDRSAEAWRLSLAAFSSSPVIVGDRIYQVNRSGELYAIEAATGRVLWHLKLAPDQLHASPLAADGKLYVPMANGSFYILRPGETGATVLQKLQLEGECLGAPAVWNGKLYVHTTRKLYCFGRRGSHPVRSATPAPVPPRPGPPVALQIVPAEVRLRPGQKVRFVVRGIDANGYVTGTYDPRRVRWSKYIPPTARVRSEMNAAFNAEGELVAATDPVPSAGAWLGEIDGLRGTFRGRILPDLPFQQDFERFTLDQNHMTEAGVRFAYPPLPWIGARFRWEIREVDGSKALTKTLDDIRFQRAMTFFGHPEARNYTIAADVRADGNRRNMSTVGVIAQRYLITLLGNSQELEISSNQERVKAAVPFSWQPGVWYRLVARVDVQPDGSGIVRAKAWKRGDPEPPNWTLEVRHRHAHPSGSPGLFGFSPQSQFRVYIDNVSVTPNR